MNMSKMISLRAPPWFCKLDECIHPGPHPKSALEAARCDQRWLHLPLFVFIEASWYQIWSSELTTFYFTLLYFESDTVIAYVLTTRSCLAVLLSLYVVIQYVLHRLRMQDLGVETAFSSACNDPLAPIIPPTLYGSRHPAPTLLPSGANKKDDDLELRSPSPSSSLNRSTTTSGSHGPEDLRKHLLRSAQSYGEAKERQAKLKGQKPAALSSLPWKAKGPTRTLAEGKHQQEKENMSEGINRQVLAQYLKASAPDVTFVNCGDVHSPATAAAAAAAATVAAPSSPRSLQVSIAPKSPRSPYSFTFGLSPKSKLHSPVLIALEEGIRSIFAPTSTARGSKNLVRSPIQALASTVVGSGLTSEESTFKKKNDQLLDPASPTSTTKNSPRLPRKFAGFIITRESSSSDLKNPKNENAAPPRSPRSPRTPTSSTTFNTHAHSSNAIRTVLKSPIRRVQFSPRKAILDPISPYGHGNNNGYKSKSQVTAQTGKYSRFDDEGFNDIEDDVNETHKLLVCSPSPVEMDVASVGLGIGGKYDHVHDDDGFETPDKFIPNGRGGISTSLPHDIRYRNTTRTGDRLSPATAVFSRRRF